MFSKFLVITFILVVLSSLTMVDGLPFKSQLAFFANETMNFTKGIMDSIEGFFRDIGNKF